MMMKIPKIVNNVDAKTKQQLIKILDKLKETATSCTGGKRVTFTNKEWKEFEKLHDKIKENKTK
jgi:hypothetical protein